jgi:Chlamydia polymorphic membrane protein (Chlamydia_PMP) repeat
MSQRQRRRRDERRKEAQRRGPSRRQLAAAGGLTAGATLAFAGVAHADTFTVSNLNDSGLGSLRKAIDDANNNGNGSAVDNVVFASGLSGTINVGSDTGDGLYPETAMNVQGPGPGTITLKGDPSINYVVFTGIYYGGSPGDPITISGLTITGGSAVGRPGGGIENHTANLTVSNDVITGNSSNVSGGGIYSEGSPGSLTVIDSTVSGNTADPSVADDYGGGIFTGSDAVIRGSAIFDNNARDGGGVYSSEHDPNSLTIQRSTIARNHAVTDDGGGVWFCCGGGDERLTIQGSTISGNTTLNTSGGVEAYLDSGAPSPEIEDTIISGNTSTNDPSYADLFNTFPSNVAFSLIGTPPAGPNGPLNQTGPNLFGVDPQLIALANNGGPTQTMALATTSPAVDKGKAFGLSSDQRGVLRPIDFPAIANAAGGDGSDIGAFELQPDNRFKLKKLKRNKHKGTGKQVVKLPLPDAGSVTIKGKGLKTKTKQVTGGAKLKLPVIPKGSKKAQENATGQVKLKAKITYKPTGNAAKTLKRKLKLLKS